MKTTTTTATRTAALSWRLGWFGTLALLLGACGSVVRAPSSDAATGSRPLTLAEVGQGYARVLEKHVDDRGEVAFARLASDTGDSGIRALENYVRAIASTPLDAAAPTADGRRPAGAHDQRL